MAYRNTKDSNSGGLERYAKRIFEILRGKYIPAVSQCSHLWHVHGVNFKPHSSTYKWEQTFHVNKYTKNCEKFIKQSQGTVHATGRRANLAGGARERVEGKIGGQRQQRDQGKRQDHFYLFS